MIFGMVRESFPAKGWHLPPDPEHHNNKLVKRIASSYKSWVYQDFSGEGKMDYK